MGEVVLDLGTIPTSKPAAAVAASVRTVRPRGEACECHRLLERRAVIDKVAAKFVRERQSAPRNKN